MHIGRAYEPPGSLMYTLFMQDGLYFSPLMQKLCINVPAGSRGGFLAGMSH